MQEGASLGSRHILPFGDAEAAAMCSQDTTIAKTSCAVTFLNPYREFTAPCKKSRAIVPEPAVASLPHEFLLRGVVGGPWSVYVMKFPTNFFLPCTAPWHSTTQA